MSCIACSVVYEINGWRLTARGTVLHCASKANTKTGFCKHNDMCIHCMFVYGCLPVKIWQKVLRHLAVINRADSTLLYSVFHAPMPQLFAI
jgi:hypothetical protein